MTITKREREDFDYSKIYPPQIAQLMRRMSQWAIDDARDARELLQSRAESIGGSHEWA